MSAREVQAPDGTAIAYDVVGDGPPVVFIHGLTGSRRAWDPIVGDLAAEFTCVRLDLRGHGDSASARDYALPALIGDVRAVVQALGLEPPLVVGNSLGGTVAAVYAAAFATRAVVAVDQVLRWGDVARLVAPFAERLRGPECLQAVLDIDRLLGVDVVPGGAFEQQVLRFSPDVVRGVWDTILTVSPDALSTRAASVLANVTVPLLALHGSALPADYAAWLTTVVPTSQIEVWDGAGHLLHLTERERFAARMRAFAGPSATRKPTPE